MPAKGPPPLARPPFPGSSRRQKSPDAALPPPTSGSVQSSTSGCRTGHGCSPGHRSTPFRPSSPQSCATSNKPDCPPGRRRSSCHRSLGAPDASSRGRVLHSAVERRGQPSSSGASLRTYPRRQPRSSSGSAVARHSARVTQVPSSPLASPVRLASFRCGCIRQGPVASRSVILQ